MKALLFAALVGVVAASLPSALMADGLSRGSIKDSGQYAGATCFLMRRSPILDLTSTSDMRTAVEQRYEHSVDVSLARSTIYSRRAVFPWALEAKAACGKAIGYFNGREVNEEMISKCDCYHGRMLAHLR